MGPFMSLTVSSLLLGWLGTTGKTGGVFGLTTVRIIGPSMEPMLRNGEVYLAAEKSRPQVGDVVVVQHPQREQLLTVKRIVRREPSGWWVEGDSVHSSNDSRDFGVVPDQLVRAKILVRLRPLLGRRSFRRLTRHRRDEPTR